VTMTMAVNPAVEVARTSTATASSLVVVSMTQPTSSPVGQAFSSLYLEDDVVLQFDATHHLSELTASWGRLAASTASFGERLQLELLLFIFVPWSFDFFCFFFLSYYSCWRSPYLRITLAFLARVRPRRSCPSR
jgi:hypothetical protein